MGGMRHCYMLKRYAYACHIYPCFVLRLCTTRWPLLVAPYLDRPVRELCVPVCNAIHLQRANWVFQALPGIGQPLQRWQHTTNITDHAAQLINAHLGAHSHCERPPTVSFEPALPRHSGTVLIIIMLCWVQEGDRGVRDSQHGLQALCVCTCTCAYT